MQGSTTVFVSGEDTSTAPPRGLLLMYKEEAPCESNSCAWKE